MIRAASASDRCRVAHVLSDMGETMIYARVPPLRQHLCHCF